MVRRAEQSNQVRSDQNPDNGRGAERQGMPVQAGRAEKKKEEQTSLRRREQ
jgi:hypothetical protein